MYPYREKLTKLNSRNFKAVPTNNSEVKQQQTNKNRNRAGITCATTKFQIKVCASWNIHTLYFFLFLRKRKKMSSF